MDLPKRKPTRLREYNYSTPGGYFVTICTKDKKKLLSDIIVGDGVLDVPQNKLSDFGKIADKHIQHMNDFYVDISVEKYVIMPNHVHMLVQIIENKNGTSWTPSPTNSRLAQFVSAFKRFCNKEYGVNIWQRSYHDHIIRGQKDYEEIWKYIDTNVSCWEKDCFYNK